MKTPKFFKTIRKAFQSPKKRKEEFGRAAARFIEENPGSFVLLADPDTDVMIGAYRNMFVPIHMKDKDGKRMHIVKNALDYSKANDVKNVDQFLLCVDSMLFNIAKGRDTRRRKIASTPTTDFIVGNAEKTAEGIKSPLQPSTSKQG